MLKASVLCLALLSLFACNQQEHDVDDLNLVTPSASETEAHVKESDETIKPTNHRTKPLDLSLPKEQEITLDDTLEFSEKTSSANFFEKEISEKRFSVGGDVIRDKENTNYVDSVEGAEITVEMKMP